MATPESEAPDVPRAVRTLRNVNKSCGPCRFRKVKCDALVVGLPCSSCKFRHEECFPSERRRRVSKRVRPTAASTSQVRQQSQIIYTPPLTIDGDSSQGEPDLLYLRVLHDAVDEFDANDVPHSTPEVPSMLSAPAEYQQCSSMKLKGLDGIDREYLEKKGVFNLPLAAPLKALVTLFFDHVHPFAPILDQADFIHSLETGSYSLFLLWTVLTSASVHASAELIGQCGYASQCTAQDTFFSRAKRLHDIVVDDDLVTSLQGSLLLSMVILGGPSGCETSYWFHNAMRLATKLDVRSWRSRKSHHLLMLHRRLWSRLYCLDTVHVSLDTRRAFLINDFPETKAAMDDMFTDEIDGIESSSLPRVLAECQDSKSFVVLRELCLIFRSCLLATTVERLEELQRKMQLLADWRSSLASEMQISDNANTDELFLSLQATSYRFECILCRHAQRLSGYSGIRQYAKQRLRSTMLELDTIVMRVLALDALQKYPSFFITTIPFLLALHIGTALDRSESELVRSMSRNSINQGLLALRQGRMIPVLGSALPKFEQILTRAKLYPNNDSGLDSELLPLSSNHDTTPAQDDTLSSEWHQWYNDMFPNMEIFDLESLDQW